MDKNNLIKTVICLFFILSCKDEIKSKKTYYNNGIISNEIILNDNNVLYLKHYNRSGKIEFEGNILNECKNGWWIYYINNKIVKKLDFINFNKKEFVNQSIYYDSNGKIKDEISSYFNFKIPDTLKRGKTKINVFYCPKFKKDSQIFYCVGYGINKNFSNLDKVQVDTFYIKNPKNEWFGIRYENAGKKTLRGFIYERYFEIQDNIKYKDSSKLILNEHKKFFEKEVYVK